MYITCGSAVGSGSSGSRGEKIGGKVGGRDCRENATGEAVGGGGGRILSFRSWMNWCKKGAEKGEDRTGRGNRRKRCW